MNNDQYLKVVKGFGLYHAIAILPFIFPVVSNVVWNLLHTVHDSLQLVGTWPSSTPSQMMFVNLFATAAFLWGFVRFRHPSNILGWYEGWGMLGFSAIVIYYVLNGASPIWLIIPLVDLPGGFLHLYFAGERTD